MTSTMWWIAWLVVVGVASGIFSIRCTHQGEKAFGQYHEDPGNPVHLARFTAFVTRSAAASVQAYMAFGAAIVIYVVVRPPWPF